jgi:hypothetical protein
MMVADMRVMMHLAMQVMMSVELGGRECAMRPSRCGSHSEGRIGQQRCGYSGRDEDSAKRCHDWLPGNVAYGDVYRVERPIQHFYTGPAQTRNV